MLIQPLDKLAVGFRIDTVQNPYHIWIYSIYHLRWVRKISGYLELIFWHLTQLVDRMFWSPVWKCFAVYKRREPLVQMLLLSMCKFYCLNLEICFDTEVGNSFTEANFELLKPLSKLSDRKLSITSHYHGALFIVVRYGSVWVRLKHLLAVQARSWTKLWDRTNTDLPWIPACITHQFV